MTDDQFHMAVLARLDRIAQTLDRIEQRLKPADAPPPAPMQPGKRVIETHGFGRVYRTEVDD